jgi:hypothetical protein
MRETTVAIEAAGPGLLEWVKRARREHTIFVVVEGEAPIARLMPVERSCTGADLADALAATTLSSDEARVWVEELLRSRAARKPPEDAWR